MRRRTTWVVVVLGVTLLVPGATPATPAGAGLALAATGPPAPTAGGSSEQPTLRLGAQGPAVRTLQDRLRALRVPVRVDGRFGAATLAAVVTLQAARGLPADGIVGANTWRALDQGGPTLVSSPARLAPPSQQPLLRLGAVGPAVTELQRLLAAAGQRLGADGRFGSRTESGVLAVQRARSLASDGVVGPATWAALASGRAPVPLPLVPTALTMTTTPAGPWRTIGARSYAVRAGDTLGTVAITTKSTPAALATANRLAAGRPLPVGATLLVPGGWRCPVVGGGFINDYGFAREGHLHEGNDLFAVRGTPIVAPVGGRVERREGGLGGHALNLYGSDGNRYYFAHMDGYGSTGNVGAGTVIGYVGNSGNASTTIPHLHFEIHPGGGAPVNPFATLTLACKH